MELALGWKRYVPLDLHLLNVKGGYVWALGKKCWCTQILWGTTRSCLVPAPLPLAVRSVFGQNCFYAHPALGILSPRPALPFFLCERSQTWVSFMARPELLLLI